MDSDLQEFLALAVVIVTAALMLWRRLRRRGRRDSACSGCSVRTPTKSKGKMPGFDQRQR